MTNYRKINYRSGEIVIVRFPFTNLKAGKVRPALVIADQKDEDLLVAPISSSSQIAFRHHDISFKDYVGRGLPIPSSVKYTKLFSLHHELIHSRFGALNEDCFGSIVRRIIKYIEHGE